MNDNHIITVIIIAIIILIIVLLCMNKKEYIRPMGYYGYFYPYRNYPFYKEMYAGNPWYILY